MIHRHLVGDPSTLAALDDLLENGTLADWRPVLVSVQRDPGGDLAQKLDTLLGRRDYQETGAFWRAYIAHIRATRQPAVYPPGG